MSCLIQSWQPCKVGAIVCPISQMGKLKLQGDVQVLRKGHMLGDTCLIKQISRYRHLEMLFSKVASQRLLRA